MTKLEVVETSHTKRKFQSGDVEDFVRYIEYRLAFKLVERFLKRLSELKW